MTEKQQKEIDLLKELIADSSIANDEREIFKKTLTTLLSQSGSEEPKVAKKMMPKKEKATPKTKATKKPKATKPAQLPSDVEAMKKQIKERTGKTEAECEDIISQYRMLRNKAKVNGAKRIAKLKGSDDLIAGTNVITPVAQIEKDAEIVKAKIEKQVEQIENKAEREVVKKDKTKDEVKIAVEKKVVKELAKLSDDMLSKSTTFVKNIQTELKKVDKTEAKNFLLGLRNEIDALLSKFGDGGMTEIYNITQMNSSSSSVNPSKFAMGGGVKGAMFKVGDKVKVSKDNDNENYDEFRNEVLIINDVVTSGRGYDDGMDGMALYSFDDIPFSLYEYELEPNYSKGGGVSKTNRTNSERIKALVKNLDNTPNSIGLAILRERLLTYTINDLEIMEKNPNAFGNFFISDGMYKDYFDRVFEELKFEYENGGEVGEFAMGGGVGNDEKYYIIFNEDGSYNKIDAVLYKDDLSEKDAYKIANELNKSFPSPTDEDLYYVEKASDSRFNYGNINKRFLDSLDPQYKLKILINISDHYGISIVDAEKEVTDVESELLEEYITDKSLRSKVFSDRRNRRYDDGGLIGNQKRIDLNKNGKIDAEDFKLLRSSMNGAFRNEQKYVNKSQSYETRYAKSRPSRTGYNVKKKLARGGFVGKAELVWRKLSASKKSEFLYENFTPQITPRGQEILVGKSYNFLPKNVKIVLASKYANVEEYAGGGQVMEIQKIKNKLISKAKSKGIYENFGQNEVRMLEDKYGNTNEVREFDRWAMNFDMSDLKQYTMGGGIEDSPSIYVADLEAYNDGRLNGEWLKLTDYNNADELMEAIQVLLDKWGVEEYAIHDTEYIPSNLSSEYMGQKDFEQLYEMIDLANEYNLPLEVVQDVVSQFDASAVEEYQGKYDNAIDFAEQLVDEIGIESFIDFQQYLDISDTDRRLLANDFADSYVDDIKNEDGGNRIIEEAGLDVSDFEDADSNTQDEMLDEAVEIVREEYYNTWYDGLDYPYYFLVEEQGLYSADDFAKANFVRIDYDKLADALEQDYTFIYDSNSDLYVFNIR